jgi:glycosyltransferase involved in cell wall biosynthesis
MEIWQIGLHGDPGERDCPAHLVPFRAHGATVHSVSLGEARWFHKAGFVLRNAPRLWRADVIVTSEYILTYIVAVFLRVTGSGARLVAEGLNVSGSDLRSRNERIQRLLSWPFRRIDLAIVASGIEGRIFSAQHDIPPEKFALVRWSYDLPRSGSRRFRGRPRPFFCMIGRNNRDIETFCAAIRSIGPMVEGIIVSSRPPPEVLPDRVEWHCNIPFDDCIDCIRNSVANVVLLMDGNRGAGHITIVTAMHCAKAQIVTDTETVRDYLEPGATCLAVPFHDADATRKAMIALLEQPELREALGARAAAEAGRTLSHAARTDAMEALLRRKFAEWGLLPDG